MSEITITLEQLRSMIGLTVRYYGRLYQIIEVLEDGPSLVLQAAEAQPTIQPSLTGEATRRTPATETVRVLNENRTELHYDFLAIELA
jgi:hypothetical protein